MDEKLLDAKDKQLQELLGKEVRREGCLNFLLQEIQALYGYLPEQALKQVALKTGLPLAQVYEVSAFYSSFSSTPQGKNIISVCRGTACHVKGSASITNALTEYLGISPGMTTSDGLFTIREVNCLGCCSVSPAMMINQTTYGRLTPEAAVGHVRALQISLSGRGGIDNDNY